MFSLVMYETLIEEFPVTKRAFPPDGKTRVACHFRRLYREKGGLGRNPRVGGFRTTVLKLVNLFQQLLFSTVITTLIWRTPHGGDDIGTLRTVFERRPPIGPTFAHQRPQQDLIDDGRGTDRTNRTTVRFSLTLSLLFEPQHTTTL